MVHIKCLYKHSVKTYVFIKIYLFIYVSSVIGFRVKLKTKIDFDENLFCLKIPVFP